MQTALQPEVALYRFAALRARLYEQTPVEEVTGFVPHLQIQGAVPRFAVACIFLVAAAGPLAALRHSPALWRGVQQTVVAHEARLAQAEAWSEGDAALDAEARAGEMHDV